MIRGANRLQQSNTNQDADLYIRMLLGCTLCDRRLVDVNEGGAWASRPFVQLITVEPVQVPICTACAPQIATSEGYARLCSATNGGTRR